MEKVAVKRGDPGEALGINFLDQTLVVRKVVPDLPADRAGVAKFLGWRLVEACGQAVSSKQELQEACRGATELAFTLRKANEKLTIKRQELTDPLGIVFAEPEHLLVIRSVKEGLAAEQQGLGEYVNWLAAECNGAELSDLDSLAAVTKKDKDLTLWLLEAWQDVEISRAASEKLGLSFEGDGVSTLLLTKVVPGGVGDRHDMSRFHGWRCAQCDGESIATMADLGRLTAGKDRFTLRMAPAGRLRQPAAAVSIADLIDRIEATVRSVRGADGATGNATVRVDVGGAWLETSPVPIQNGIAIVEERLEEYRLKRDDGPGCKVALAVNCGPRLVGEAQLVVDPPTLKSLLLSPAAWECDMRPGGAITVDLRSAAENADEAAQVLGASGELSSPPKLVSLEVLVPGAQGLKVHGLPAVSADPWLDVSARGSRLAEGDQKRRTGAKSKTSHPDWSERFVFPLLGGDGDVHFSFEVRDAAKGDSFLGKAELQLDSDDLTKALLRPRRRQVRLGMQGTNQPGGGGLGVVFLVIRTAAAPLPGCERLPLPAPPQPPPAAVDFDVTESDEKPPPVRHPDEALLLPRLADFFAAVGTERDCAAILATAAGIEDQLCDKLQARYPDYRAELQFLRDYHQDNRVNPVASGGWRAKVAALEKENEGLRRQLSAVRQHAARLPAPSPEVPLPADDTAYGEDGDGRGRFRFGAAPQYPSSDSSPTPSAGNYTSAESLPLSMAMQVGSVDAPPQRRGRTGSSRSGPSRRSSLGGYVDPSVTAYDPHLPVGESTFGGTTTSPPRQQRGVTWGRGPSRSGGSAGGAVVDDIRPSPPRGAPLYSDRAGDLGWDMPPDPSGNYPEQWWALVTAAAPVALRHEPNQSAPRMHNAEVSGAVRVHCYTGKWALVENHKGHRGFIRSQYLHLQPRPVPRSGSGVWPDPSPSSVGSSVSRGGGVRRFPGGYV
eukprot:TRINITY_DN20242_c0_g1_i1.p1 TRINITY_DN20242_c0_g1~~TRINITY_DN20242_c0_g1_i1.p1  ORF type:complete len:949 (+),score=267.74 TRINITY_DN20242_c0_g1_i1:146-2992(+)